MNAAPSVPSMQASGTLRLGFSTALEFCAADSIPRNAHNVSAMLELMPWAIPRPCGFHAAPNVAGLNQNQPNSERNPTGTITPHTVTEPIRPVIFGPPKFAMVVIHNSTMTPMHVAIGVDESHGKNAARYPTAEIAIATLPIGEDGFQISSLWLATAISLVMAVIIFRTV